MGHRGGFLEKPWGFCSHWPHIPSPAIVWLLQGRGGHRHMSRQLGVMG